MSESEGVFGPLSNISNQSDFDIHHLYAFFNWFYVWGTISCLLIIVIVLGNTLVIISVATNTKLQTKAYIMLTSLSAADLLVGLVVVPIAIPIMSDFSSFRTALFCAYITIGQALSATSLTHILAVNLDRYVAICYPLRYETLLSKSKIGIVLLAAWVFPLCMYLPTLAFAYAKSNTCTFGVDSLLYDKVVTDMFFLVTVSLIIGLYIRILIVSKAQIRKIHSQTTDMNQRSSNEFKSHLKVVKAIGLVLGAFILCWTPLQVIQMLILLSDIKENLPSQPTYYYILSHFLGFLSYLNSALNPLIYAFTQQEFKHSFKILLCGCKLPKPRRMNSA